MEMEDESPIDRDKSSSSSSYNTSSDVVPDEKSRAGISNELDSVAVTPPRDLSLETYEKKLALHAKAIADAAENNSSVPELQELSGQVLDMDVNPFARKNNGEPGHVRSVGMNGMNKTPEGESLLDGVVGMDGMNKSPGRGESDKRPVGMNGMNKAPLGGWEISRWRLGEKKCPRERSRR